MKIKVIIPNSGMNRETLDNREKMLSSALSKDTEISVECIKSGPDSIESNTDESLAGYEVIKECIRAEQNGFDAIVIYCFSDLAIEAARENVSIPVIGPGEVTLAAADMISNRFLVVTTTENNISRTYRRLMKNKIASEKMSAVKALNIPVVKLRENPDITKEYLEKVIADTINTENIDTVILACLGMAEYGNELERKYGIKILDPSFIAVSYAEHCIRTGIRHSRKSYAQYSRGKEYGLF